MLSFPSLHCTALHRTHPGSSCPPPFDPFPFQASSPSLLSGAATDTYLPYCRLSTPSALAFFSNLLALSVSSSSLSSPLPHKHSTRQDKHPTAAKARVRPDPAANRSFSLPLFFSSAIPRYRRLFFQSFDFDSASLHSPPDQTRPDQTRSPPSRPSHLSLLSRLFVARL
ncbi:hypothetical protein CEP52_014644 [Fusarium oligoseptatum]|uniref:Uncharacterized protein n=2 Tax=Fusarium solani species complex TaxID=232080 RepID=A0A428SKE8_9HYPO|nr:hypothetical protein CEP51_002110 [Fusarium floridanum]RSL90224.1 hypothetical protein CEP52_014644 [Fusarium oligoseptatum]